MDDFEIRALAEKLWREDNKGPSSDEHHFYTHLTNQLPEIREKYYRMARQKLQNEEK